MIEQTIKQIETDNIFFVADMHELTKPNADAKRIWENMQKRSPTNRDLKALYENSVDPLVSIIEDYANNPFENWSIGNSERIFAASVVSLGDMVANRINFGEGTEKSVIGKMAKKARELGVPQHEYIADNFHEQLAEVEDWAYRNSFWTEMRFEALKHLLGDKLSLSSFIHINGNADAISSFVTRDLLNADFKSPNEIYIDLKNQNNFQGEIYIDEPGIIRFEKVRWCRDAPDPDFDEDFDFKLVKDMDSYGVDIALAIPYTLNWNKQLGHLDKIKLSSEEDIRSSMLLIHEPLDYSVFNRKENVEGMATYKKAISLMPEDTKIIHGHTHAQDIVEYGFNGNKVYQIPPNLGVKHEILIGI
ncbi:hypothetical protein CEE44_00790 [Candidatus Woesearchaeota archaeon B3_Woes]|nr:MAG: hypothetical protein CEE44_00790 [Candidatus Woesearchaeota archaeon B3_Woes]